MRPLMFSVFAVLLPIRPMAAPATWQTLRPAASSAVLRNPDCGLAVMPGLAKVETIPAWILDTCSIAYFRLDWASVVDEHGEPKFDALDREVFKGYRDRGLKLSFRIMAANPHSEQEYVTPKTVIERDHIPTVRHTSVYGKSAVDPVFWDDRYLAAYNRMTRALGAYLDGQPWAGPVDLGGMGDWGEMHLERWTQRQLDETGFTHAKYLKAVLSMMTDMNRDLSAERREFCYAPILMPDPVPVFDQLVAWATDRGWWLRNDGCTPAGPQPYLKPHLDRLWPRVGFIAEPNGSITNSGESTNKVEDYFKAQLKYHASVCNLMGTWDLKDLPPGEIEAIRAAARKVGYRLVVDEAVLPATVAPGGWLTGRITLANRGVAPPYGSAAFLQLELVRDGKPVVQETLHPDPPLAALLPDTTQPLEVLAALPSDLGSAPVQVRIALVDPVHGPLRVGTVGQDDAGWLSLGTVSVSATPTGMSAIFRLTADNCAPAPGVTRTHGPDGISLKGTAKDGWNYGWGAGNVKVEPHRIYVMHARVRARPVDPNDSQLYFKFGVDLKGGGWGGNLNTAKYDYAAAGTWQDLTAVYRPGPQDASFGIALEKGRTAPSAIDADLGEWSVDAVPIP